MEKILLIEDDKSYIENIKILLEEEGYDVIAAENGLDGIDITKNEEIDLVICDIMLPDIDGYTVLKELRRREKTKLIPFIFLTAKAAMSDLRSGMNLGADDYLTKPFHSNDLLSAIKTRLTKSKSISDLVNKTDNSIFDNKTKLSLDDYLFLPTKNNYEVIPVSSVVYIESEGVYSNVFSLDGKKTLVRKLLKDWEETLPNAIFIRIHKSFLVNIKQIKKIEKWFNGSLKLYLHNNKEPLIVSRRYASRLRKKI